MYPENRPSAPDPENISNYDHQLKSGGDFSPSHGGLSIITSGALPPRSNFNGSNWNESLPPKSMPRKKPGPTPKVKKSIFVFSLAKLLMAIEIMIIFLFAIFVAYDEEVRPNESSPAGGQTLGSFLGQGLDRDGKSREGAVEDANTLLKIHPCKFIISVVTLPVCLCLILIACSLIVNHKSWGIKIKSK